MSFRKTISILILLFFNKVTYSQSVGQDADNFSSIVLPSANISLDLTEAIANFSFYKDVRWEFERITENNLDAIFELKSKTLQEVIKEFKSTLNDNNGLKDKSKNFKFFVWGLDIKGKSKNGISNLFSSDRVSSSSSISGLFGYRWSKFKYDSINIESYVKIKKKIYDTDLEIISKLEKLEKFNAMTLKEKIYFSKKAGNTINEKINTIKSLREEIKTTLEFKFQNENTEKKLHFLNKLLSLSSYLNDSISEITKNKYDISKMDNSLFDSIQTLHNYLNDKNYKNITKEKGFDENNIFKTSWSTVINNLKYEIVNIKKFYYSLNKKKLIQEKDYFQLDSLLNQYKNHLTKLDSLGYNSTDEMLSEIQYQKKNLLYIRGGVFGSDFLYDLENNGTTKDTRFEDRSFNGYSFEVGTTIQTREFNFFGFSLGYNYTHNLSQLKTETYSLQVKDPNILNCNLVNVTEVKAISGDYDRFNRIDINFDYARLFKIKESHNSNNISNILISVNPYLRHRIYDNAKVLKNNTVLGLGLHAFNSADNKIMGGIYIQTPDFFGSHKNDQGLFEQGINFGLIFKYNIQGFKTK